MFRDTVRLSSFIVCFASFALTALAQQTPPQTPADQQKTVQPAPPAQTAPSSATPAPAAVQGTRPPEEPNVLEDGGFSIEPIYWMTKAQPGLKGGASAASAYSGFQNLDYPGKSDYGLGVEAAIPTGHSNTLRISLFRVLGNANSIVGTNGTIVYGEPYSAGDYLVQHYNVQMAKISWDYLSYTWQRKPGNIHFKTLYEVQYVNFGTQLYAPFVPITTDASGNTDTNSSSGSQSVILPTLGAELEQSLGGKFRWEVKGSGFGIPHHSVIWDAQADIALRLNKFELIAGEKAYHFKSSPQGDQYVSDTLQGLFVGLRYYVGAPHR
jgi:hypothetical protein